MEYTNIIFSVVLHTFLLFTFLSILFWTYISKVEHKTLSREIDNAIEKSFKNVKIPEDYFTPEIYNYLKAFFSGENITNEKNNDVLVQYNITIIILLFVFLICIIFVRYVVCGQSIDIMEIIGENAIVLIIVGIIEFFFFKYIASKYVPVLPSYLPTVFEDALNQKLS